MYPHRHTVHVHWGFLDDDSETVICSPRVGPLDLIFTHIQRVIRDRGEIRRLRCGRDLKKSLPLFAVVALNQASLLAWITWAYRHNSVTNQTSNGPLHGNFGGVVTE